MPEIRNDIERFLTSTTRIKFSALQPYQLSKFEVLTPVTVLTWLNALVIYAFHDIVFDFLVFHGPG